MQQNSLIWQRWHFFGPGFSFVSISECGHLEGKLFVDRISVNL